MEPESTDYSYPILGPPNYSPPESPLSTALYSQRFYNDSLISQLIDTTLSNNLFATSIGSQNREYPQFLSQWWKKGMGAAEIPILLKKVGSVLGQEMEVMNAAIKENREEQEYIDLEIENESLVEEKLRAEQAELEGTLAKLTKNNYQKEEELNSVLSQRENFYNTIRHLQQIKTVLTFQRLLNEDQERKIAASLPHLTKDEAHGQYYHQLAIFLGNLLDRRQQVQTASANSNHQLTKINTQIDHYKQETRLNQARKEIIIHQHGEISRLKKEYEMRQQSRRKAEQQRKALEQQYCEQQMEKMAGENLFLQERMNKLLEKASELVRNSIKRPQLTPIEAIVKQNAL